MQKNIPLTYRQMKVEALSLYYEFCRDGISNEKSSHANVLAQVDYHFDETFDFPIEKFMFYVIELVISGGWYPEIEKFCRSQIEEWLRTNDLKSAMEIFEEKEAVDLMRDLELLRLTGK